MSETILIVEDEAIVALTLEEVLIDAGYTVCGIADRALEALVLAREHRPDIAIVDVRLAAGDDGIELAEQLALMGPILILFATGNPGEVRQRARVGQGCLSKPFQAEWLLDAIAAIRSGTVPSIPSYFGLPFAPVL